MFSHETDAIPRFPIRMAALPPLRARARRLLLATVGAAAAGTALGYLVAVWPAPEPIRDPFVHDTAVYSLTMSSESPLLRDDPRCALFLDDWMRRPGWSLTLVQQHGDLTGDVFTVDATGRVTWTHDHAPPRTLHVSPVMLKRLHDLAGVSCKVEPDPSWRGSSPEIRLAWGPTAQAPGPRLPETSPAHVAFAAFLDDVVASAE